MTVHDAQAALDALNRRQEQTREAYVRHAFSAPYRLAAALALFAIGTSFDLPNPWRTVALLAGNGLLVGSMIVYQRRAPVQRRPGGREMLFSFWLAGALVFLFVAVMIAVRLLGLPAACTVAAAVVALATMVAGHLAQPVAMAITRRDGHG